MNTKLPQEVITTLTSDPAFSEMLERCLEEEEFVANFSRLYGVSLPRKPSNPIYALVDEATEFTDHQYSEFFNAFIPFVHRAVYLPLKAQFEASQQKQEG